MSGLSNHGDRKNSPNPRFSYAHSPGFGGFAGTPLFLNTQGQHLHTPIEPAVDPSVLQKLLPPSVDILKLLLSVSSHRTSTEGVLRSWMGATSLSLPEGRLRLATGLAYVLMDGSSVISGPHASPLTWSDIRYLQASRKTLLEVGDAGRDLAYLVSIVLEDVLRRDLSLKFRLESVLDFNDQITSKGWLDGGSESSGIHSEELRGWFRSQCLSKGIDLIANVAPHIHDLSPSNKTATHSTPQIGANEGAASDDFAADIVDRVFNHMHIPVEIVDSSGAVTPKQRAPIGKELNSDLDCREIIVVDVQTDHVLRRHINKAAELRKQFPNERVFVQELKKFIHKRLHFEVPESRGAVLNLARSKQGFVHIGDVRIGAHSRHFAILFKTLCDATGVYCRLVRDLNDVYYNVVMISEPNTDIQSVSNSRRDSNSSTRSSKRGESDEENVDTDQSSDEEEGDDAPEELVPIFWESSGASGSTQKKIKLAHPLDCLLQRCNNSSDPIDLDDFFSFDRILGKGSFGEVWKVDLKVKNQRKGFAGSHGSDSSSVLIPNVSGIGPYALKIIPPQEADKEEASFMRIYSHARVINVIAVFRGYQVLENRKRVMEKKPAMCILMEMADKCLETILSGSSQGDELSPKQQGIGSPKRLALRSIFRILIDSAKAMTFLHSPVGQRPHLVHRDLKPGNILITSDMRAIVTDFGVARMNPSLETNLTVGAGTEGYMAPEQKTLLYDRPADVYSFGVIIARILGVRRWKDATNLRIDDFDENCADPVLVQLCLKCVQVSPLHRPSFQQIHQVLLCEFIRRTISRTVIHGELSADSENIPPKYRQRVRSSRTPVLKHGKPFEELGTVGDVSERRNPPRVTRTMDRARAQVNPNNQNKRK
jgi:serine/threonine protein kinase